MWIQLSKISKMSNSNELEVANESVRRKRASPSLKARAVSYLARREYSRSELRQKLKIYLSDSETEDDLDELLDELLRKGYLSDERFARSRVRVRSARYGNARIAYELKSNGISSDLIDQALNEVGGSEFERARTLWFKKFGKQPEDFKERGKQMRYLLARGFSMEVARKVVQSDGLDEY